MRNTYYDYFADTIYLKPSTRKLVKDGGKVFGWIVSVGQKILLHTYSEGYIGYVKDGVIYDREDKTVCRVRDTKIDEYIIRVNYKSKKYVIKGGD